MRRPQRRVVVAEQPADVGASRDVVIEFRPDVDGNRLVRGARRRLVLRDMLRDGVVTKRQHDAAERFLDDLSVACGGGGTGNLGGVRATPGSREAVTPAQSAALRQVYRVVHLLGLNSATVFWWVVLSNGSLRGYEDRHQVRHGRAKVMLVAALDALDSHYYAGSGRDRVGGGVHGV